VSLLGESCDFADEMKCNVGKGGKLAESHWGKGEGEKNRAILGKGFFKTSPPFEIFFKS